MKKLKLKAWPVFLLCPAFTIAVAALNAGPLMEWNISAPRAYASQPPLGLYMDVFRALENSTFLGSRIIDARQSATTFKKVPGATRGRKARPSVIMVPVISGQSQDQTVFQGGFASFWVTATGAETITYQWCKDGAAIPGGTRSTFSLSNVQASDAGQYSAVVSNAAGSAEAFPTTLTVNVPAMLEGFRLGISRGSI